MKYVLIAIIVIIAILIILYIAVKASQSATGRVEQTEKNVKAGTTFMRDMTAKAETLMKTAKSDNEKQAAKEVYEAFRYSDPKSTYDYRDIEDDIRKAFDVFSKTVKSGADVSAKEAKDKLIALVNERNAVMRNNKLGM